MKRLEAVRAPMNRYLRLRAVAATAVCVVGCMLAVAAPAGAASPVGSAQFRTVDVPSSACAQPCYSPPVLTQIYGVNNAGTLIGTWQGTSGDQHGFIQQPGGQTITIDASPSCCTDGSGINDAGTAVGAICTCGPGAFLFHGWVRSPDGSFTELDDPLGPGQTHPLGINDSGVIVGYYQDDARGAAHGFVYARGKFTTLDFPGSTYTNATAINNSGTIVGWYADALGFAHGFRYQNGKFTEIDAPDAGTDPMGPFCGEGTFPSGISAGGAIVGDVCNDVGVFGWRLSHGQFLSLNDPMSAAPGLTVPEAISENGRMVAGFYYDTSFVGHGLVATLTP